MRTDLIRMPGRESESRSAVLQRHTGFAGHEARAEAAEQRLDEGDDIALSVRCGQVDRVAVLAAEIARWAGMATGVQTVVLRCCVHVDGPAALGGVILRQ